MTTNQHLNRIKILTAAAKGKVFIECFSTDEGAILLPNSNFAIKELVLKEEISKPPFATTPTKQSEEVERLKKLLKIIHESGCMSNLIRVYDEETSKQKTDIAWEKLKKEHNL